MPRFDHCPSRLAGARDAAAAPGTPAGRRGRDFAVCLGLIAITWLAYRQLGSAGFIWDDDGHVTRPELRPLAGLWRIWFEPGATQQYYPVLCSAFWLEHRLWGDLAGAYHTVNVLLHGVGAALFYLVLRRLRLPGAMFAAAIFALHPVAVESVAWISEQKNTLSAVFYFAAALAYLRFDDNRRWTRYGPAFGLFALAVLSKSVTATLPAALLVVFWWRRGRLEWRRDAAPLLPWFALAAGAGAMTVAMERTVVGASGPAYALTLVERVLLAGRVVWFYAGKVVWPADLMFIYPRWTVAAREPAQYAYPAAVLAVLAALWALRHRARGPLAAALLVVGTLFPALGFFNVFPFLYSYVADHFQYLAAAMLVAAVVAGLAGVAARWPAPVRRGLGGAAWVLLGGLGWLTARQAATYRDSETLWRATLARNPACWMAYNNLGSELLKAGRLDEALTDIRRGLELAPDNVAGHTNLGNALLQAGRPDAALTEYARALVLEPDSIEAHNNLGTVLLRAGRVDEAMAHFQRALQIQPDFAKAHTNLGDAWLQQRRWDAARAEFAKALTIDPDDVEARNNLGIVLVQTGHPADAVAEFERAVATNPGNEGSELNLGNTLAQLGRMGEAVVHFQRAVAIRPAAPGARGNLGIALLELGRTDEAIAQLREVVALTPRSAGAHSDLGQALLQKGRPAEAEAEFALARGLTPAP